MTNENSMKEQRNSLNTDFQNKIEQLWLCTESFHHKFSKFFKENSAKKNKKFINLLNHHGTYAPPYINIQVSRNKNNGKKS